MNFDFATLLAAAAPPAGGAEIGQIVIATAAATIVTCALLYLGFGHRSGRVKILQRLADHSERASGMPGWVAFPSAVATVSLLTALFGMYWDISLHIDNGRDAGPLANPAHYFILAGLFGIFSAGFFAMVLPKERPSAVAIRIGRDWWAPLGGVLICACGAFSLIGFPLDDIWHRLFGQDVTLWGPTHLMLIGGAAMTLVGIAVLSVEGMRANAAADGRGEELAHTRMARAIALTGGLMLGLSTFQAEFDFGVPQFQLIFQPMLLMLAAGVGLVLARIYAGPRRGAGRGRLLHRPARRAGARWSGRCSARRPPTSRSTSSRRWWSRRSLSSSRPGSRCASGSRPGSGSAPSGSPPSGPGRTLWMPLPWPAAAFPEAGAARLRRGDRRGDARRLDRHPPLVEPRRALAAAAPRRRLQRRRRSRRWSATASTPRPSKGSARRLPCTTSAAAAGREVEATVRIDPPDAAAGAEWFDVTAWQGGGLVVDPLKRTGPGVYRTHRADPGLRRLEGDDPPPRGRLAGRAADLPAARRGDPGRGNPGPGALHPLLRRRAQTAAARAEGRQPDPGRARLLGRGGDRAVAARPARLGAAPARGRAAPAPRQRRLRLRGLAGFQHGGGR